MSGSREVSKANRPSLPDAVETPGELPGVKEHFHDNHSSDLKISGPENLLVCKQQEAVNSSQDNSRKRNCKVDISKIRLTREELKQTKRKSKLPHVQLFEGHCIYSPSVRVRNVPVKQI